MDFSRQIRQRLLSIAKWTGNRPTIVQFNP
jgi:hypothetical protein